MSASERMAGLVRAVIDAARENGRWLDYSANLLAAIADLEARNAALTEALKNAEALALRAEVAEMSARSREADAARVALGAANGETLIRAAQRVAGDAKMGAIAPLAEARLTVGAALALPEVQDGSHVVELLTMHGAWAQQTSAPVHRVHAGPRWQRWEDGLLSMSSLARPARLVPISLADLPPDTRGPLP